MALASGLTLVNTINENSILSLKFVFKYKFCDYSGSGYMKIGLTSGLSFVLTAYHKKEIDDNEIL